MASKVIKSLDELGEFVEKVKADLVITMDKELRIRGKKIAVIKKEVPK